MSVPVVAARRSPFCAADGVLAGWHPVDLAAHVLKALEERNNLDPALVAFSKTRL